MGEMAGGRESKRQQKEGAQQLGEERIRKKVHRNDRGTPRIVNPGGVEEASGTSREATTATR